MKTVFRHWSELERRLDPAKKVLWLFDFDGTLAAYASHPDRATMSRPVRTALTRLLSRFPTQVGVISGRELSNLRQKVGLPGLIYSGSHGLELRGPGVRHQFTLSPRWGLKFQILAAFLRRRLPEIEGLWVEVKTRSRCIHFRQTRRRDQGRVRAFIKEVDREARRLGLRSEYGAKTLELLPGLAWNKGSAVKRIKMVRKMDRIFYIGDDTTDESVFRIFRPPHVMIRVGRKSKSFAEYNLPRQQNIRSLLERLYRL